MQDVKAVGSALTPAQQEEVLEDLTFFLDEFGSTRAVRVKLQAQERAIARLERQLRHLLGRQREDEHNSHQEEKKRSTNEESAAAEEEDVDITMRDLDFFIKTFGSTRAVREKLQSREKEIWSLQRLVEWLEQHQELLDASSDGELRGLIPERGLPGDEKGDQSRGAEVDNDTSDGARLSVGGGSSKVACVAPVAQVDTEGGGGDVLIDSPQKEDEMAEQHRATAEDEEYLAKDINVVPMETQGDVSAEFGKELRRDEVSENFRLQPILTESYEGQDFANCGVVSPYSPEYQRCNPENAEAKSPSFSGSSNYSDLRDRGKPLEIHTEDSSMVLESSVGFYIRNGVRAATHRHKYPCSRPGCTKSAQRKGLCCRHGGYYICNVEGCSRRAVTQNLCPLHGGGTRCKLVECGILISRGCSGYCRMHAPMKCSVAQLQHEAGEWQETRGYYQGERKAFTWELDESKLRASQSVPPLPDGTSSWNPRGFIVADPLATSTRSSHVTCKAFGCMKWVMQGGDPNEYCPLHRDATKARVDSPMAPTSELKESFIHPVEEGVSAKAFPVDPLCSEDVGNMNSLCRVPGCENVGKQYGAKKGFCCRHGGGVSFQYPGCTKQLQPKDLHAFPEGLSKCEVEDCEKHALLRGMCSRHHLERAIEGQHNSPDEMWTQGWPKQIPHKS